MLERGKTGVQVRALDGRETMISFFVPGSPQPKGSSRAFIPKGWNRAVITNANPRGKDWDRTIALAAMPHRPPAMIEGPVSVTFSFSLAKPKSAPKTKAVLPAKRPDLDKLCRSVLDALTGIFWCDDSQVCRITATKVYGDPVGVNIEVSEIDP